MTPIGRLSLIDDQQLNNVSFYEMKGRFSMRARFQSILVVVAVLFTAHYVLAQGSAATLEVRGDVLKPGQWSVEALKQQFAKETQTVKFTLGEDKQPKTGTGIPLLSLIKAAELKTEKTPKHYDLSFMVILEAHDGYRVYFSFAELSPQSGHAEVWLLWDVDGKPLAGKEAPLRLVVSTDRGPDRCIYGIASITLVDGTKLANQLAMKK
jgi:DMSO/TMAO reductase YedYZ molybdopterin-dependent catalytic subunit